MSRIVFGFVLGVLVFVVIPEGIRYFAPGVVTYLRGLTP